MDVPAIYRIRVVGRVDPDLSPRLSGMQITVGGGDCVESILIGRIQDQSALSGVLNTLYELHLPVTNVECLDVEGVED